MTGAIVDEEGTREEPVSHAFGSFSRQTVPSHGDKFARSDVHFRYPTAGHGGFLHHWSGARFYFKCDPAAAGRACDHLFQRAKFSRQYSS